MVGFITYLAVSVLCGVATACLKSAGFDLFLRKQFRFEISFTLTDHVSWLHNVTLQYRVCF